MCSFVCARPFRWNFPSYSKRSAIVANSRLFDLSELHRTYVGSVQRGERNGSIDNMERLATALGTKRPEAKTRVYCVELVCKSGKWREDPSAIKHPASQYGEFGSIPNSIKNR
jgi:hypothetical protein